MLTVWESTIIVDNMDFQTLDGQTIDIKTASRNFHTRILVPHDQYQNQPKDFYVGIRISENESTARIIGYTHREGLKLFTKGDYVSYAILLNQLTPIEGLLTLL